MRVKPSPSLREISLLYVEDDEQIREALASILKRYVQVMLVASDGEEGWRIFEKERPDIVVTDIRMPKLDGVEMVRRIKERSPATSVVFTTAFGVSSYLKEAIDLGAEGYLIKPVDRNRLMEKLNFLADAIVNERRRNAYYRLLSSLFDAQKEAIVLVDEFGEVVLSNLTYKKLCLVSGCRDDTKFYEMARLLQAHEGCAAPPEGEAFFVSEWLARADGSTVCLSLGGGLRYYDIHVRHTDDLYLVEMLDVSRFKEQSMKLERESLKDALTVAYNRKILPKLRETLKGRNDVCMILGDLDHFKQINDTYGHAVGDEVLKRVAETMRTHLREGDYFIRWGGEEFLAILQEGPEAAMRTAEKLRMLVADLSFEKVGQVTMSFGLACGKIGESEDFDRMVERADKALYRAKKSGRNRVERESADG